MSLKVTPRSSGFPGHSHAVDDLRKEGCWEQVSGCSVQDGCVGASGD